MDFYLLGKKIRYLRNEQHLSQADLAEMIDVSTKYIRQIERGDRKPSLETLVSLCNVLNTNMDYILSDSLPSNNDPFSRNILAELEHLSLEEQNFLYHTLHNYNKMKCLENLSEKSTQKNVRPE